MVGKSQPITKADRAHFALLKAKPCVCCRIEGVTQPNPTTAHHLLSGGRRRGHQQSIPLCMHHHLGTPIPGWTKARMTELYGPSLANGSKPFRARYGDDEKLLALAEGNNRT